VIVCSDDSFSTLYFSSWLHILPSVWIFLCFNYPIIGVYNY
jgi:hypothetical protein